MKWCGAPQSYPRDSNSAISAISCGGSRELFDSIVSAVVGGSNGNGGGGRSTFEVVSRYEPAHSRGAFLRRQNPLTRKRGFSTHAFAYRGLARQAIQIFTHLANPARARPKA